LEGDTDPFFTANGTEEKHLMSQCRLDFALLDFGGVIAEEGFAAGMRAIAREARRDEAEIWGAGLHAVWDSGYVFGRAPETAFWALFKERTGISGDEAKWREYILSRFTVRPFMLHWTAKLAEKGIVTAILSDQTDWLDRLDAGQGFYKYFSRVFNSYDHGLTKREPEFFKLALRELNASPERALFVDDNPGNVERARELGMHAILYVDREGFERDLKALCPDVLG
jgi:putative hydrolase of the HAD superfamily